MSDLTEIKKNPYKYICNYAEEVLPSTGREVFKILALQPASLLLPPFFNNGSETRSNIHCFFLAPSGSGKSTVCKMFMNFTYNPIFIKSITSAELYLKISQKADSCSIVIDDFAQLSRDADIIKILEGALGEEKRINRLTKVSQYDEEVNVTGLLCGVPMDLSYYLAVLSGLIFRCAPVFVAHDIEEHARIGEKIANGIGKDEGVFLRDDIRQFFVELARVQAGEDPNIKPIEKYEIRPDYLKRANKEWELISNDLLKKTPGFNWFREYLDFVRFLNAHAFLNIFNGRSKEGVLIPNDEDFNIALHLMIRSIQFKYRLIHSEGMLQGVKNAKDFHEIMSSKSASDEEKNIMRYLSRSKMKKTRTFNL